MRTTHTIRTEVEVSFVPVSLVETETVYPTLDIEFSYAPGCPETGPTYDCGGTPAEPPEVEIVSVKLVDGDGLLPTEDQLRDWADKWLTTDEGFNAACEAAEDRRGPDRDAAYDAMRDERDGL